MYCVYAALLPFQFWVHDLNIGTLNSYSNHIKASCHFIAFNHDSTCENHNHVARTHPHTCTRTCTCTCTCTHSTYHTHTTCTQRAPMHTHTHTHTHMHMHMHTQHIHTHTQFPLSFSPPMCPAIGSLAVLPIDSCGRNTSFPTISGHAGFVTDFDFSPFHDHLIATGSEDSTVSGAPHMGYVR